MVLWALPNGSDVTLNNDNFSKMQKGSTPLHWAAWSNKLDCVELLLAAGAAPDSQEKVMHFAMAFCPFHIQDCCSLFSSSGSHMLLVLMELVILSCQLFMTLNSLHLAVGFVVPNVPHCCSFALLSTRSYALHVL